MGRVSSTDESGFPQEMPRVPSAHARAQSSRLTSGERKALVYIFRSATLFSASREWPEPRACDRTHTHRLEGTRASVSMSSGGFAAQNGAGGSYTNGELLAPLSRLNALGIVNACVERVGCFATLVAEFFRVWSLQ